MKVCRSSQSNHKTQNRNGPVRSSPKSRVNEITQSQICSVTVCSTGHTSLKLTTDLVVEGQVLTGVVDTGASVNIIPHKTLSSIWSSSKIRNAMRPCSLDIRTFSGEKLPVLGQIEMACHSPDNEENASISFVVTLKGHDMLYRKQSKIFDASFEILCRYMMSLLLILSTTARDQMQK